MFECHANYQIAWESFVDTDQQKTCLGYATLLTMEMTDVKEAIVDWFHYKLA